MVDAPAPADNPTPTVDGNTVVARWLGILIEPGSVVELRALNYAPNGPDKWRDTVAGFYDTEHLADMAARARKIDQYSEGVYFTLNPLNPDLKARRANKALAVKTKGGFSAGDKDVLRRRWLLYDADPVRIAGVSSNDAEKAAAKETIGRVCDWLTAAGWPLPIEADSGNGFHLLYRIDQATNDGGLIEDCLKAIAAKFDSATVKIDQGVYNPARICKLYGTLARKGESIDGRPHRRSRILKIPGCPDIRSPDTPDLQIVSAELLNALAAMAAQPSRPTANGKPTNGQPFVIGTGSPRLKVAEWLADRGCGFQPIKMADGTDMYRLDQCPFDASHVGKDVSIFQYASGATHAKCLHNSCAGRKWEHFRDAIGKPDAKHYDPPRSARKPRKTSTRERDLKALDDLPDSSDNSVYTLPAGKSNTYVREHDDDPHRLARLFLWRHRGPNEQLLLRYWQSEFWRWRRGAYRKLSDADLRGQVVAQIKDEFDDLCREAQRQPKSSEGGGESEPPAAAKVTTKVVNETMQALASLTILPSDTAAPKWLDGVGVPDVRSVIPCRNAIINLPALVSATPGAVLPPTPDLFALSAADIDFDLTAPEPVEWFRFLDSIWPNDAESQDTLAEWLGYLLTLDTSQQKILLVIGPPRSGKGTIGRVIRALLGDANVSGPTLGSLGTDFGLAPLVGKSAAIVADARLGGRSDMAAIAERLLSISGEDGQSINRKYLPPMEMRLPTRFVILTNELPRVADSSGALAGRFIILHMTETFYGREDRTLEQRLLAELPGILLWAIDGWRRLQERGHFTQPESAMDDIRELEDLASPVRAFVRDKCKIAPTASVKVKELYEAWKKWCEENGKKEAGTVATFGRDLRSACPWVTLARPRLGGDRERVYRGLDVESGIF